MESVGRRRQPGKVAALWEQHAAEWRDPAQICSQWREASIVDPRLLEARASKHWWRTLADLGITLLVTREYEHLVMAASVWRGSPHLTFFPVPHPSGLAVDRDRSRVALASTRNPNQVLILSPVSHVVERLRPGTPGSSTRKRPVPSAVEGPLVPTSSATYAGSLYLHDLAFIGGRLHANAVGHNAVVRFGEGGKFEHVWWPRSVERRGRPDFSRNYLQLNSIAAGRTLRASYFTASSASIGRWVPGQLRYPVDGRGVVFSGRSGEPVCTGLTRPHSARLAGGRLWVANSGYGEVGFVAGGTLDVVARLPGWTRGLAIVGDIAFVGTSRVIPRYAAYAPGLDLTASRCAVYAVSLSSGRVLGSLEWPAGNQVFGIDWLATTQSAGLPFNARGRRGAGETALFYGYRTD